MFQRIGLGKINIFLWEESEKMPFFLFLSRHIFLTKIFLQITKKGEIFAMKSHKYLP